MLSDSLISLRAVEPTDLDILCMWENDTDLWKLGSTIAPYSRKLLWEYIKNYTSDIYSQGQLRLMITTTESKDTVGMIDIYNFDPHNRRAAIGILIGSGYQRKGYGRHALLLTNKYASDFLGIHSLWATVPVDNQASLMLFKKSGYKICGRMRSWLRRGKSYTDAFLLQHLFE